MIMSEMCQKVSLECKTFVLYFAELYAILENIMQHICERFCRKRRRLQQWIRYISPERSVTVFKT